MIRKNPGKDNDGHEAFRTVQRFWRFTRKILVEPAVFPARRPSPSGRAQSLTRLTTYAPLSIHALSLLDIRLEK
jgi:hypothetical protein